MPMTSSPAPLRTTVKVGIRRRSAEPVAASVASNKESIVLDLKSAAGVATLIELIQRAETISQLKEEPNSQVLLPS